MSHRFASLILLIAAAVAAPGPLAARGDVVGMEHEGRRDSGTSPAVLHLEMGQVLFETTIANELGNGNKLVDVEVLTTTGPVTLFSGVFYPLADPVRTLIQGDEAEWDAFIDTVRPLEGRWLDVEVGFHGTTERWYSAIFLEDGNDHDFVVDTNMSDAGLQTRLEEQLRNGYALIDFQAHTIPGSGDTAFDAIWTRDARQPMTHLYYDLELGDLVDLWSPLAGRIIDFERYHSFFHGEERFAIVVANHPGGDWYIDTYMTQPELGTTNINESDGNTHLIDLHVFTDGSDLRFSGVWGESWKSLNEVGEMPADSPEPLTGGLNALINTFETVSPNGEGIVGFYAKNLRTDQSVGYRADEPFYLASAAKTAAHVRFWMQVEAGHFMPDNELTQLAFSQSGNSGAPWYVDERCPGTNLNLGFGTGQPSDCNAINGLNGATQNNLGQSYSLDRFDTAMMVSSDNAATSALIDDPGVGLSFDSTNLNEWLSSVDGVGQGWGLVTSIHDVDRMIFWQGQHTDTLKTEPSFFLVPGHTFGGFRNDYLACTVGGDAPVDCVSTSCQRCFTGTCPTNNPSCNVACPSGESCVAVKDPWGDLRSFHGLSSSAPLPDRDPTVGRQRYFAMGLNSATPRAYANLLEKFWELEFTSQATRNDTLGNMTSSTQLDDSLCRADFGDANTTCDPGEGFAVWAKGGSKGSDGDGTQVCTGAAIMQMLNGGDVFAVTWMTRDSSFDCFAPGAANDLRNLYAGPFGQQMLQAIAVDLVVDNGSFTPTTVVEGGEILVDINVDNIGGGHSDPFEVWVYASTDQSLDGSDEKLAEINFGGPGGFGGTGVGSYPIQLPSKVTLPAGTYYLLIDIDPELTGNIGGQVGELDETDASNTGTFTAQQLTILPPCPDDDLDGYADCDAGCLPGALFCDDCDDAVASTYPGATEQCNGVDDDCDTVIDNDIPTPTAGKRIDHEDPVGVDRFGEGLANLGDVNGDGFDDLAIGMPEEDLGTGYNQGIVRVISGADLATLCDAALPGGLNHDQLGGSVAAAGGDLSGNGMPDFVAGVTGYDNGLNNTGGVAVFSAVDCGFVRVMVDPAMDGSDRLGVSVASIGDVDNDAVPDIAAGSLFNDLSGSSRGAISVFSGADGSVLFTSFDPAGVAEELGATLAGPGDLTGDGIPDFVAGAPQTDAPTGSQGALYVFSGADGTLHDRYEDPLGDGFSYLGESLAALGDLNTDGVSELAAGQTGDIIGGSGRLGSVAIFDGATGVVLQRLTNPIGIQGEQFGSAVAAIADVGGDGLPDVLVGADSDDDLAMHAGSVFIFDSITGDVLHHVFDPQGKADDELGARVVSLGDLSGDGLPEFAASAPRADDVEANQAGHVIVFSVEEDCDADGVSPYGGDCDDDETSTVPGAIDSCDAVDNDCDGLTDEDSDGDGFGVCADCDDLDARVFPGAAERCNGIDDDCDFAVDNGDDLDADGYDTPCDCRDDNASVNPGASEAACDHIDNDCNGIPDDGAAMLVSVRASERTDGYADDLAGADVASLGDVNADGVDDYAAGVPGADLVATGTGVATVFDGATGQVICTASEPTQQFNEGMGTSVAGVGDVDGDGAGDLAAGAPWHNVNGQDEGVIYLFSGDDCSLIRLLTDPGAADNDRLGFSAAALGDLTGDGIGEIAGGAPWAQTAFGNDAGAVLVWNGASGALLFKLTDNHTGGSRLGESVAGVDDVNADGIPDIVAGAPFDDGLLGSDVGSVLVFSGADGTVIHKLFDPQGTGGDDLGTAVAGIGDLDGDAVPEILAGAPDEDSGGGNNGAILVFSGADGSLVQRVPLVSGTTHLSFGTSVAALPDMNGDGVPEFAGGAPDDDTEGQNTGRVVIYSGADYSVLHDLTLPGSSDGSLLGSSLDPIGDLNGDGLAELLVGQPEQDTDEDVDVGRVILFSFESDCDGDGVGPFENDCDDQDALRAPGAIEVCDGVDNDCDLSIDEDEDGDGSDACADCAPGIPTINPGAMEVCNAVDDNCNLQVDEGVDLDGDGYTVPCDCNDDDLDINFSAIEVCNAIDDNCDGEVDEGFASPLDQVRIEDPLSVGGDALGTSLARVGDVDGDGVPDFVSGVPGDDTAAAGGGSAILFSGATRNVICRLVDPSAANFDALGYAVAGIGDVTGDGTPDVAVGARWDDQAGGNSGAVQIFSGASCDWVRELVDPAGAADDNFGTSVAAIGDVTSDGVTEIAVGAPRHDQAGLSNAGKVTVFDGATGAFLYNAADPHARASDQLGTSVASLGDVDFDGVPDFASGAPFDAVGTSGTVGTVNLFSGIDGSWIRSLIDPQATNNDRMGSSIAAAGDVNGDGVPDLLAGCEGDDAGTSNAGSVLAFSGADGGLIRRYVDSMPLSSAELGVAVAAAGDLNGDRITEVVGGAPNSARSGSLAGEVIVFDGASGAVLHRFTDAGSLSGDDLGTSVVVAGDLTGGGGIEIVAGAPNGDPAGLSGAGYLTLFSIEPDCDGDGQSPLFDCDDTDADSQGGPGAAEALVFTDKQTLQWSPPSDPGGSPATLGYDVVRSDDPADFTTAAVCVESDDASDTIASDTDNPVRGALRAYLVRVENRCGESLGLDGEGTARSAAECP